MQYSFFDPALLRHAKPIKDCGEQCLFQQQTGSSNFLTDSWLLRPLSHMPRPLTEECDYLDSHDFLDSRLKLQGVVEVHRHDVRSADVLLCIGMLRVHLRKAKWAALIRCFHAWKRLKSLWDIAELVSQLLGCKRRHSPLWMWASPWKTRGLTSCVEAGTWAGGKCSRWRRLRVEPGLHRGIRNRWKAEEPKKKKRNNFTKGCWVRKSW